VKNALYSLTVVSAFFVAAPALAGERIATIEVTGLSCPSCPYIAAQAVMAIPSAEIVDGFYDAEQQLAHFVIRYDDEITTLTALIGATDEYGYPSSLVQDGGGDS